MGWNNIVDSRQAIDPSRWSAIVTPADARRILTGLDMPTRRALETHEVLLPVMQALRTLAKSMPIVENRAAELSGLTPIEGIPAFTAMFSPATRQIVKAAETPTDEEMQVAEKSLVRLAGRCSAAIRSSEAGGGSPSVQKLIESLDAVLRQPDRPSGPSPWAERIASGEDVKQR